PATRGRVTGCGIRPAPILRHSTREVRRRVAAGGQEARLLARAAGRKRTAAARNDPQKGSKPAEPANLNPRAQVRQDRRTAVALAGEPPDVSPTIRPPHRTPTPLAMLRRALQSGRNACGRRALPRRYPRLALLEPRTPNRA